MRATKQVTRKSIHLLRRSAESLAERISFATDRSPDLQVRREGGRMSEVLEEWLEGIELMYESGDDDLEEKAQSFAVRLSMAHEKVSAWGVPRKLPSEKKAPKKATRRRKKQAA